MNFAMMLMAVLIIGFFAYLLYSRQMKWLLTVLRNATLGIVGILVCNFFFASVGLAVGVNTVTASVVGLLGAPGFLLLYAAQLLLG